MILLIALLLMFQYGYLDFTSNLIFSSMKVIAVVALWLVHLVVPPIIAQWWEQQ